jgi:hypothetical protein
MMVEGGITKTDLEMSLQKIKAEELVKVNQKASKKITILCF